MKRTINVTINLNVEEETFVKMLALAGDEAQIGDYLAQLVGEAYAAQDTLDGAGLGAGEGFDETLEAKLAMLG